jgi:2,5-diketo-D-gluconate reductase A
MIDEEARTAVTSAIEVGYRLIDTAEQYGNEIPVGRAIRECAVPRDDIFLATKFNAKWHGEELVLQAHQEALDRLGLPYVDLMLIHWPNPWLGRYVEAWRGMIRLRSEGIVRAIGTSNFTRAQLRRLMDETGVAPEVNQVELDPTLPRRELRAFHEAHGIVTEAWSPLGRGGALLSDPAVAAIAAHHGRSSAQIVLRWHVQLGIVPVARSSDPKRIAENLDVFDFELSRDDLDRLDSLDQGRAPTRDPEEHGH